MSNRMGTAAVLLMIVLSSMLVAVSTIVNAACQIAGDDVSEYACDIAGRSVLAAYDKRLKQDYGLFAFKREPSAIESDMKYYMDEAIGTPSDKNETPALNILGLSTSSVDVSLGGWALSDIALFEDQIKEQMKYRVVISNAIDIERQSNELAAGITLAALSEKILAIMTEFQQVQERIGSISGASDANVDLEVELKVLLQSVNNDHGQGLSEVQKDALRDICRALEKNDEELIFNISQMTATSERIIDAIEAVESFVNMNVTLNGNKMVTEMLESAKAMKRMLESAKSSLSDDWEVELRANIDALSALANSICINEDEAASFIERYEWNWNMSLFQIIDPKELLKLDGKDNSQTENLPLEITESAAADTADHAIRNETILDSLPSHEFAEKNSTLKFSLPRLENIGNLRDVLEKGVQMYLVDRYIMTYMTHYISEHHPEKNFYCNEIEYILYGNSDDNMNHECFARDFRVLRTGLNIVHILSDPIKKSQAAAMAAGIAAGPLSGLADAAIITAWAAAEAENDLKLIENGKRVSIIKTVDDWALSLDNLLKSVGGILAGSSGGDRGSSYGDYLELFLLLETNEAKLFRTMDIIQINMQYRYDRNFLMKERYCGFTYKAFIDRKTVLPSFDRFFNSVIESEGEHAY